MKAVEQYELSTDTWRRRPDAFASRYHAAAAATPAGHVYVVGGFGSEHGAAGEQHILGNVERFDPITGVWTRRTSLPTPAYALALATFDCARKCALLAAGGFGAAGVSSEVWLYDPIEDVWSERARLGSARLGLTLIGEMGSPTLFALGGYELRVSATASARHLPREALGHVSEYDARSDSWWVVPRRRQWRRGVVVDWRHPRTQVRAARRAFLDAMSQELDHARWGPITAERLNQHGNTTRLIYLKQEERDAGEPTRCTHGRYERRRELSCLRGFGLQRDERGAPLAPGERVEPSTTVHADVWHAPIDLEAGPFVGELLNVSLEAEYYFESASR